MTSLEKDTLEFLMRRATFRQPLIPHSPNRKETLTGGGWGTGRDLKEG